MEPTASTLQAVDQAEMTYEAHKHSAHDGAYQDGCETCIRLHKEFLAFESAFLTTVRPLPVNMNTLVETVRGYIQTARSA